MLKKVKSVVAIVALVSVGLVSCERISPSEEVTVTDSTAVDSMSVSVTEVVTITDVSVTADSAQ